MVGWMESKRACRIPERLCSDPRRPVVTVSGNVSENRGCVQSRHSSGHSVRHELQHVHTCSPWQVAGQAQRMQRMGEEGQAGLD